jgi:hypothetical protein
VRISTSTEKWESEWRVRGSSRSMAANRSTKASDMFVGSTIQVNNILDLITPTTRARSDRW